eukprot:10632193-Ditylum_brightwellii.AAC.1
MKTTNSRSHQSRHNSHRGAVRQPRLSPFPLLYARLIGVIGTDCSTFTYSKVYGLLYVCALLDTPRV